LSYENTHCTLLVFNSHTRYQCVFHPSFSNKETDVTYYWRHCWKAPVVYYWRRWNALVMYWWRRWKALVMYYWRRSWNTRVICYWKRCWNARVICYWRRCWNVRVNFSLTFVNFSLTTLGSNPRKLSNFVV